METIEARGTTSTKTTSKKQTKMNWSEQEYQEKARLLEKELKVQPDFKVVAREFIARRDEAIREEYTQGVTQQELAEAYDLSRYMISKIVRG